MKSKKTRRIVVTGIVVCLLLLAASLGYVRWLIQNGLDKYCAIAQQAHPHPGDDVAALMEYVQSDAHNLRERNLVVWALGQARDERAAPVLKAYWTNKKCNHDKDLCQHELKKALKLCGEVSRTRHPM